MGSQSFLVARELQQFSEGFASLAAASRPCPPAHAALVRARAEGTIAPRLSPRVQVDRKLSARPSTSSRVVSTRNPTKDHMRTSCKRPTLRSNRTSPLGPPTHPVRHLSRLETRAQVLGRIPQPLGRRPGRLTLNSGVSGVQRTWVAAAGSTCRSCASPSSATQWLC